MEKQKKKVHSVSQNMTPIAFITWDNFLLEHSYFTMLCQFLLCTKMNQDTYT